MKQSRYYQMIEGKAHIYDSPFPEQSVSESIVNISDLSYYRKNFQLSKVWRTGKTIDASNPDLNDQEGL